MNAWEKALPAGLKSLIDERIMQKCEMPELDHDKFDPYRDYFNFYANVFEAIKNRQDCFFHPYGCFVAASKGQAGELADVSDFAELVEGKTRTEDPYLD